MTDSSDAYRIKLIRRVTIQGRRLPAGAVLAVAPGKLSVASFLCRNGAARPVDAATARDVELFDLMVQALPVGVPWG